jgi:putative glutamine amidotransferase
MGSPIVAIACSFERFELPGFGVLAHHAVFERYVDGPLSVIDAAPVLIPAVGRARGGAFAEAYVPLIDGLILPGGASHVAPELYGAPSAAVDPSGRDPDRDATVLPLIRASLRAGVPVLGICRGMQELNVALGGTLIPAVHDVPGRRDHRSRKDRSFPERYEAAHRLRVAAGGWLERELATAGLAADDLSVNSLHSQGVDRLGDGVVAEAWADDGTVEAVHVAKAPALALGVQWHLEWHAETPLHATLWRAFGRACEERARRAGRAGEGRP